MAHPDSATMLQQSPSSKDGAEGGVPEIGDVIGGKYRVEAVLGVGGMGVVLSVRHQELGELYAMKFLLPKVAGSPETVARFMREARAAVKIKSEHVAHVSDVGQLPNGSRYIVMEHLHGTDLGKLVDRGGALPPRVAVDYMLQVCAGLADAHALGIVHRDLKPSNLFLTERSDGTALVKVLDFGISKETGSSSPSLTETSDVFGSPAYMSPEQIRSAKSVDARSDIWSLGVILFELLTKSLPFEGHTSPGLLAAISADPPKDLRAIRTDAPEGLAAVVARCLVKSPADRYGSIGDLALALAPFASPESEAIVQRVIRTAARAGSMQPPPMSVPPPAVSTRDALAATERSFSTTAAPKAKSKKVLYAIGGVLAVALGGGVIVVALGALRGPRNTAGASARTSDEHAQAPVVPTLTTTATAGASASAAIATPNQTRDRASDPAATSSAIAEPNASSKPSSRRPTHPPAGASNAASASPPPVVVPPTVPSQGVLDSTH